MSKLSADEQDKLPAREFAFPRHRKAPIEDAAHVRAAIARFKQASGVTDAEPDEAWHRIKRAAKKYDVQVAESSWCDIGE
jgi:hypothetical protein